MKKINSEILSLALPSILANITVPLVGMVDIAVAGNLDSDSAPLIGGIAIGSICCIGILPFCVWVREDLLPRPTGRRILRKQ